MKSRRRAIKAAEPAKVIAEPQKVGDEPWKVNTKPIIISQQLHNMHVGENSYVENVKIPTKCSIWMWLIQTIFINEAKKRTVIIKISLKIDNNE